MGEFICAYFLNF